MQQNGNTEFEKDELVRGLLLFFEQTGLHITSGFKITKDDYDWSAMRRAALDLAIVIRKNAHHVLKEESTRRRVMKPK